MNTKSSSTFDALFTPEGLQWGPRRGRTAWSSSVEVNGKTYAARFWYDGSYANNAKEDAAEVALQRLGIVPTPRSPYQPPARYGSLK
ncbi:hypothetical protein CAC42_1660 [Sphaceloma murrayae]|uniref:DRBM domain-containing protein n=1 Tax=Sphaceloma murrayae TaxID=2082308 RepID=A0A2K1QHL2_9PEZI|nr:hypothetical protein CAC42_1660 [Sphaceloma murrayae]